MCNPRFEPIEHIKPIKFLKHNKQLHQSPYQPPHQYAKQQSKHPQQHHNKPKHNLQ